MAVILAQLRQLPAFWACQERAVWNNATRELVAHGQASVGALDDLEVRCKARHDPLQLNSTCSVGYWLRRQHCARIKLHPRSDWFVSASSLHHHQQQPNLQKRPSHQLNQDADKYADCRSLMWAGQACADPGPWQHRPRVGGAAEALWSTGDGGHPLRQGRHCACGRRGHALACMRGTHGHEQVGD